MANFFIILGSRPPLLDPFPFYLARDVSHQGCMSQPVLDQLWSVLGFSAEICALWKPEGIRGWEALGHDTGHGVPQDAAARVGWPGRARTRMVMQLGPTQHNTDIWA